jgi:hypothetical protein
MGVGRGGVQWVLYRGLGVAAHEGVRWGWVRRAWVGV